MKTITDLVESFKYRNKICLSKDRAFSFQDVYFNVLSLARGFLARGLQRGDPVMIVAENSPWWMMLTLALNYAGLVDVPRGVKASDQELNYIIRNSQPKLIVVEDEKTLKRVGDFKPVVSISPVPGIENLQNIIEQGADFQGEMPLTDPGTHASHLYTSGTTGEPKGAMLTHGNYVSNFTAINTRIRLTGADKALSVLPLWHVFERMVEYVFLSQGADIFYSSVTTMKNDLLERKPTIFAVVPRILEKIYSKGVLIKLQDKGKLTRSVFKTMIKMAADYRVSGWNPLKFLGGIPSKMLDKSVFLKIREAFGGRLRFIVSGGGKLSGPVDAFFNAVGIPVLEGYGLTETSPVISVRSPENLHMGTVGKPLDNLEVTIIDPEKGNRLNRGHRGVIFVKGPSVMEGYYNNAYETDKVLKDGLFDTGDIGYLDFYGNLVITGRKKNIIVLSNGENISPEPVEETLRKCPYISNAILLGQDWKGVGAIIEPDFENLERLNPKYPQNLEDPEVLKFYRRQIREFVSPLTGFREYECIKAFRLLPEPLALGKELTETLKIKRAAVENLYGHVIESIYREIHNLDGSH